MSFHQAAIKFYRVRYALSPEPVQIGTAQVGKFYRVRYALSPELLTRSPTPQTEFYRVRYALSPELGFVLLAYGVNSTGLDMRCPRNDIYTVMADHRILQG